MGECDFFCVSILAEGLNITFISLYSPSSSEGNSKRIGGSLLSTFSNSCDKDGKMRETKLYINPLFILETQKLIYYFKSEMHEKSLKGVDLWSIHDCFLSHFLDDYHCR